MTVYGNSALNSFCEKFLCSLVVVFSLIGPSETLSKVTLIGVEGPPRTAVVEDNSKDLASSNQTINRSLPFKQDEVLSVGVIMSVLATLLLMLVLAYLVILGLKRFSLLNLKGGQSQKRFSRLESMRVDTRISLHLVRVDTKEYLVAQNGESVNIVLHNPAIDPKDHLVSSETERDATSL